jgi:DNA-directed RNA polymerase subunit RPC12/RpoP
MAWICRNCRKDMLGGKEKDDGSFSCPHCGLIIYSKKDLWKDGKEKFVEKDKTLMNR